MVLQDWGCSVRGTRGITEEFCCGPQGANLIPLPSHTQHVTGLLEKIKIMNHPLFIFPSLDKNRQKSLGQ